MNTTRCGTSCPIRRWGRTTRRTAVELAALVLIKDKGAPTGQPIDAYLNYARAYNGAGPAADAYAARVIADAHAYQGAGTIAVAGGCTAAFGTPIVPGSKARILADGVAAAPANAPAAVQAMIAAGNRINHFAYSYGGAHGDPAQTMNQSNPNPAAVPGAEENGGPGYDCSSATSYVLWGGGLGQSLLGRRGRRLDRAGERRRSRPREVGDDLRQRRARLHRGRGHLLRHRRRARQPAQPAAHRAALEHRRHRTGRVRRSASARAVTAPERFLGPTIHALLDPRSFTSHPERVLATARPLARGGRRLRRTSRPIRRLARRRCRARADASGDQIASAAPGFPVHRSAGGHTTAAGLANRDRRAVARRSDTGIPSGRAIGGRPRRQPAPASADEQVCGSAGSCDEIVCHRARADER